jgi:Ca-activated chloride channel homolog
MLHASNGKSVKVIVPISATAAKVTLGFPAKVKAGADFAVKWTGPGHQGDYIDLVKAGHSGTSGELDYAYVRNGETLTLTAPDEAGSYVVRYLLKGSNGLREITTSPLTVE